jgi:cytochrome c oxidase subunit II
MLVSSFRTSRALGAMNNDQAITINVYGHMWWWEVEYPNDKEPYKIVETANEIHVPVGVPIRIRRFSISLAGPSLSLHPCVQATGNRN